MKTRIILSRVVLFVALAIAAVMPPLLMDSQGLEVDGRHVTKACGIVPAQPEILPITGKTMNIVSDHNLRVTTWLECAKRNASGTGDYDLIQTVEHAHGLWVLEGHRRVAEHYPVPKCLQEKPPTC